MTANRKSLIVYLAIIHILLVVVLLKSDFINQAQSSLGLDKTKTELTPHFNSMLTFHKRMDGNIPDSAVIVIGDSITQGLAVSAVSPISVNFGIGSDTTAGVIERISKYKSLSRAKAIIIAIGANDLKLRNNAEIMNNYKIILNKLPGNTPIIASAVLPIDEEIKNRTGRNTRVNNLNVAFRSLCEGFTKCTFINPSKQLIDLDNNLLDSFHVGDGIHLNSRGYSVWIDELRKVLVNI